MTGELRFMLSGHSDWILNAGFSADGRTLVTASDDETARVWDTRTGKEISILKGHTSGLSDAALDDSGELAVTAGEDQTARLWNARSGRQVRAWGDHESEVRTATFTDTGKHVRTVTARGTERIWSVQDGFMISKKESFEAPGRQAYDNCFLIENGHETEIRIGPTGAVPSAHASVSPNPENDPRAIAEWLFARAANVRKARIVMTGHRSTVQALALSPDGALLATIAGDKKLMLWSPVDWERVSGSGRKVLATGENAWQMAFSPRGDLLATAPGKGTIRLYDPTTGKVVKSRQLEGGGVGSLVFTRDGDRIVARSGFDSVKVWNIHQDTERTLFRDESLQVDSLAVSPDERLLAIALHVRGKELDIVPNEIWLRDMASGNLVHQLRGRSESVRHMAFSPDGKTLYSASLDGAVRIWDVVTGKERIKLLAHVSFVDALAVSGSGDLIASAGREGTVSLWDAQSGNLRCSYEPYAPGIRAGTMVFSHDGKTLVTGGSDGVIKFWDVQELLAKPGLN